LATIKKDNKEMEKLLSQLCKTAANSKFLKGKIHRRLLHIPDDDTRGEGRRLLNKKGILLFLPELRCYSIANDGKTVECLNASKSRYDFGIFCKENVKNILNIKMPETSDAETEDEMHDSSSFDAYGTPYIYPATLTFTCQFSPFNEKSCYYDLDGIDCKEREENRSKLEALSKANATYDSAKATAECDGIKTANMKKLSEESKE